MCHVLYTVRGACVFPNLRAPEVDLPLPAMPYGWSVLVSFFFLEPTHTHTSGPGAMPWGSNHAQTTNDPAYPQTQIPYLFGTARGTCHRVSCAVWTVVLLLAAGRPLGPPLSGGVGERTRL